MNPIGVLLAVVAGLVAIVAVVGVYNSITTRMSEGSSLELLNTLRANVEDAYSGQSSYGANDNLVPTLDAFGRIPDRYRKAGPPVTIEHSFGQPVSILGNGGRFAITFQSLDNEVCVAIGRSYTERSRGRSGIIRMQVNTAAPAAVPAQAPRVWTLAQLVGACDEGAEANNLTFVFG